MSRISKSGQSIDPPVHKVFSFHPLIEISEEVSEWMLVPANLSNGDHSVDIATIGY